MPRFLYTAWFQDQLASEDDQDYEWPACFEVEADAVFDAQAWGDKLAIAFAVRTGAEVFLRSSIEPASEKDSGLFVVPAGYEATDEEIGW